MRSYTIARAPLCFILNNFYFQAQLPTCMANTHKARFALPIIAVFLISTIAIPSVNASEPNDDFSTATPLQHGVIVDGTVNSPQGQDTVDYYRIDIEIGDAISFEFYTENYVEFCIYTAPHSADELACEMVDEEWFLTDYSENSETYYVKVECGECEWVGYPGEYSIRVHIWPDDIGNTISTSTELVTAPGSTFYSTSLPSCCEILDSDVDYFSYTSNDGDEIELGFTSGQYMWFNIKIYDILSGSVIGEDYEVTSYSEIFFSYQDGAELGIELSATCWAENECSYVNYTFWIQGSTYQVDTDGDGFGDYDDLCPNTLSTEISNVNEFGCSPSEWDTDGDGHFDNLDVFPADPSEWSDSDEDGVGDNSDAFPNDANETTDSDSDNMGDNADAFPNDPSEWYDTDGDGIGDNADVFPVDPSEWSDSDGDGFGNNSDAFPMDPSEWLDSDGDGVGDNTDVFPNNPDESADADGDGVGNNGDAFPSDANETVDFDGDGIGDNSDPDDDSDGFPDISDVFPYDSTESVDTDRDGIGNNADADDDGDGVVDTEDAFPYDSSEHSDSDGDGVGDNADLMSGVSMISSWGELMIALAVIVIIIALALIIRGGNKGNMFHEQSVMDV